LFHHPVLGNRHVQDETMKTAFNGLGIGVNSVRACLAVAIEPCTATLTLALAAAASETRVGGTAL
jgi:hypothetical protein